MLLSIAPAFRQRRRTAQCRACTGGGGLGVLIESFVHRQFWTNNPYNREIRVHLAVTLPKFLVQRGWRFPEPRGGHPSRFRRAENERIVIALKAGADFSAADVVAAGN